MNYVRNKRGLSTIVATLLIILLTLVAVGIIWIVVRNVIQNGAEQISLGKFTLHLEIKTIARDFSNNSMDIKIKRNAGEGDLFGIVFIAESEENTEVVKINNISFKQLEEKTFNIVLNSSTNISTLKKVSIAPIFMLKSGKEVIGEIADEYVFTYETIYNSLIQCTLTSECNDSNFCTNDNCVNNECSHIPITLCVSNDGCCPIGCNSTSDNNCLSSCGDGNCNSPNETCSNCQADCGVCPPVCGNSIIEGTEQCDCGLDGICTNLEIGGETCSSRLTGYTGILNCTSSCTFNTNLCIPTLTWIPNSNVNNSLSNIGSYTTPSIFYKDSSWYLISGEFGGKFYGYTWNGSKWTKNLTINASLPDIGDFSTPSVFYKDSSWYLISGELIGVFYGYTWNGVQWVSNSTISAGLPDIGAYSAPSVFYKDSSWYLISGANNGQFYGYNWNGVQWVSNSTITTGLPDIGSASKPFIFYKDSSWYLISGEFDGYFYGYNWNGNQWIANSTISGNLPDVGFTPAPSVFKMGSNWYLISGEYYGNFFGFSYT